METRCSPLFQLNVTYMVHVLSVASTIRTPTTLPLFGRRLVSIRSRIVPSGIRPTPKLTRGAAYVGGTAVVTFDVNEGDQLVHLLNTRMGEARVRANTSHAGGGGSTGPGPAPEFSAAICWAISAGVGVGGGP